LSLLRAEGSQTETEGRVRSDYLFGLPPLTLRTS
jgi:hypothetical protein